MRQAQHEAAFLRSLVQEQAARLQSAAEEAGAAAAAAAAAEREREQRWRNRDGGGGGSCGSAALDRQRQQQLRQQQLQQRLNYLEVRHELLIDLWTLRVLDNEVLGQYHCWAGAGGGGGGGGNG